MKQIDVAYPKRTLAYALASGLYSGCIPVVTRGTAGSVVSVFPAVWLWLHYGSAALVIGAALWFVAGWWAVQKIETTLGPAAHDASVFVADEWCGQWLCLALALPLFTPLVGWWAVVISLLCFALFDGLKPWPIRAVDKLVGGGFGVMFDDVLAAIGACGLMFMASVLLN